MDYNSLLTFCKENNTELVAVSKTRSVDEIMTLYNLGQRHFGENRVQEWREKKDLLPDDIQWHLIGHLQSNKVKYLIPEIHLIHSVDSLKLAEKINDVSKSKNVTTNILIQYKVAQEESKFGLDDQEENALIEFLRTAVNIRVNGIMGMGTFTSDESVLSKEFTTLISIFKRLKNEHFIQNENFKIKSIGMSGDYKLAIEHGSNMVRIGSLLFNSL